jgi:hypothetical protein
MGGVLEAVVEEVDGSNRIKKAMMREEDHGEAAKKVNANRRHG